MLDIKWIRENPEDLDKILKIRNVGLESHDIINLDSEYRELLTKLQILQNKRNKIAKQIGNARAKGGNTNDLDQESKAIKESVSALESSIKVKKDVLDNILFTIPNVLLPEVPVGKNENDNKLIKEWGKKRDFTFNPKRHFDIGESLKLMDFETAAKISGSRFVILKGALAKLERALSNFMLDIHTQEFGYQEITPPILVKDKALFGTGLLPKFADKAFQTTKDHWLIPTAEVPLSNMVMDKTLEKNNLPMRLVAHTPCFRSESGAAGKDTRGMIRLHQFSKVELVSVTTPEQSIEEHERMTRCAETILERLELPYRRKLLCTGDMGIQSAKTYDLEVWLPGENKYREISSCSICLDYQARRMKAKFKDNEKNRFLHTLNGSGLAIGRTVVAILENYQQEDGSIIIPEALRLYMGNLENIKVN